MRSGRFSSSRLLTRLALELTELTTLAALVSLAPAVSLKALVSFADGGGQLAGGMYTSAAQHSRNAQCARFTPFC